MLADKELKSFPDRGGSILFQVKSTANKVCCGDSVRLAHLWGYSEVVELNLRPVTAKTKHACRMRSVVNGTEANSGLPGMICTSQSDRD
jgi:hypothetical protein